MSVAGGLSAAAAAQLGVPAGIPVAAGAADTAAAILGTGVGRYGEVQLTIGTGAQIVRPVAEPASGAARPARTCTERRRRTGWYAMAATVNAGAHVELGPRGARRDLGRAVRRAEESEPHSGDPLFLPHLAGERTPHLDPTLRGAWLELSLSETDRAERCCAVSARGRRVLRPPGPWTRYTRA